MMNAVAGLTELNEYFWATTETPQSAATGSASIYFLLGKEISNLSDWLFKYNPSVANQRLEEVTYWILQLILKVIVQVEIQVVLPDILRILGPLKHLGILRALNNYKRNAITLFWL